MNERRERAELDAVLASTLFARAPDLSKILKHVCERRFSNQAGAIKEYSIAVEALGRGPDFRPEEDSIVRVQAARLRKHLKRYYETDGARHPLQIRISTTGYKPEFVDAGTQKEWAAGAAEDRNSNRGPASAPAVPHSLETLQPPGALGESGPAVVSEGGASPDRRGAPRSGPSRRKLVFTLALIVAALIAAAVGARAVYRSLAASVGMPSAPPAPPIAAPGTDIRVGFTDPTFLDVAGGTWLGDRYFTGGEVFSRTDSQIRRTFDQSLYRTGRRGSFRYAIPLPRGV